MHNKLILLILSLPLPVLASYEPSEDYAVGIEINPLRLIRPAVIQSSGDDVEQGQEVVGGVSLFLPEQEAEIAIPIMYGTYQMAGDSSQILNIDLHFRKFVDHAQEGLYYSAVVRYVRLSGTVTVNPPEFGDPTRNYDYQDITHRLGIGAGMGYRYVSDWGFYWGISFSLGGYAIGDGKSYTGSGLMWDQSALFADIELFKIGYKF